MSAEMKVEPHDLALPFELQCRALCMGTVCIISHLAGVIITVVFDYKDQSPLNLNLSLQCL